MKNKPYVKQYNSEGLLINPIVETYKSVFKNRRTRRAELLRPEKQKPTRVQTIPLWGGGIKVIYHFT